MIDRWHIHYFVNHTTYLHPTHLHILIKKLGMLRLINKLVNNLIFIWVKLKNSWVHFDTVFFSVHYVVAKLFLIDFQSYEFVIEFKFKNHFTQRKEDDINNQQKNNRTSVHNDKRFTNLLSFLELSISSPTMEGLPSMTLRAEMAAWASIGGRDALKQYPATQSYCSTICLLSIQRLSRDDCIVGSMGSIRVWVTCVCL